MTLLLDSHGAKCADSSVSSAGPLMTDVSIVVDTRPGQGS